MYLVHSTEHLCCVGDSLHCPSEDIQTQLQPLKDVTALAVQTQALQCLKAHIVRRAPALLWHLEDSYEEFSDKFPHNVSDLSLKWEWGPFVSN